MSFIPRVIHYCWFGGNPLPEPALKCIESWKKFCPGYEIKCWDESNYNIHACPYIEEAYEEKKWAFVSDYARFDILYQYGGIYFDVDVELIAPIEDILDRGPFFGVERSMENKMLVAPGLGMAAYPQIPFYGEILEEYRKKRYKNPDGTSNQVTVVQYTTEILTRYDLKQKDVPQEVAGIWIYPWDYFCPIMYQTDEIEITENTRSIHHYHSSWLTKEELRSRRFQAAVNRKFGPTVGRWLGNLESFPYRVKRQLRSRGFRGTVRFVLNKLTARK